MRSIERRFKRFKAKNPTMPSNRVFAMAIRGQKFSKDRLMRHFNKLVNKEDYVESEKGRLIQDLLRINESEL